MGFYGLINSLIYFSNNSVACSNINECDGNINITLSSNNYSYVLDNFNLTEGVSRQNSPLWFAQSTLNEVHIASNLTDSIQTTIILSRKSDWGNGCSNVNKVKYTPSGGVTITYTGQSAKNFCNTLTTSGQTLTINPSVESNELEFEIGSTPLSSSILRILVGILAMCVVIFTIGGSIYYIKNNFEKIELEHIIKYSIGILLFTIAVIILINYILEII